MGEPVDWARAFARQADADFRSWELLEGRPGSVATECHKLMLLQMACEKLCKAHLVLSGTSPSTLQSSHAYVANPLPIVIRQQMIHLKQSLKGMQGVLARIRQLANEIELLSPSVRRDHRRPDNCEYPWEVEGRVMSPLDWSFAPTHLCTAPAGRTFLKLLRGSIERVLHELETKR